MCVWTCVCVHVCVRGGWKLRLGDVAGKHGDHRSLTPTAFVWQFPRGRAVGTWPRSPCRELPGGIRLWQADGWDPG